MDSTQIMYHLATKGRMALQADSTQIVYHLATRGRMALQTDSTQIVYHLATRGKDGAANGHYTDSVPPGH